VSRSHRLGRPASGHYPKTKLVKFNLVSSFGPLDRLQQIQKAGGNSVFRRDVMLVLEAHFILSIIDPYFSLPQKFLRSKCFLRAAVTHKTQLVMLSSFGLLDRLQLKKEGVR
jgi:hypothetical protein